MRCPGLRRVLSMFCKRREDEAESAGAHRSCGRPLHGSRTFSIPPGLRYIYCIFPPVRSFEPARQRHWRMPMERQGSGAGSPHSAAARWSQDSRIPSSRGDLAMAAKKGARRKTVRKPMGRKATKRKTIGRKTAARKPGRKAAPRKSASRKSAGRKTTGRKTIARKATARKRIASRKSTGRRTAMKKSSARKAPARKSPARTGSRAVTRRRTRMEVTPEPPSPPPVRTTVRRRKESTPPPPPPPPSPAIVNRSYESMSSGMGGWDEALAADRGEGTPEPPPKPPPKPGEID